MESFRLKLIDVARESKSKTLLHFANSLIHYFDFMVDVQPTDVNAAREFANHYVRQQERQYTRFSPYRGGPKVDAQKMASTELGNVVKFLEGNEEIDFEFVPFAIEFFQIASQAATFNEHVQGGAASSFKNPGWMGKKNNLENELDNMLGDDDDDAI